MTPRLDKRARELSMQEWKKWIELCERLEKLGAVTPGDLKSSPSARETDGQRLLQCIREWAKLMAEISAIESHK